MVGTANTDICRFTSTAVAQSFVTNQMYTWTPPAACSGAPANGTTTTSAGSVCSGTTVNLAVTGSLSGGCGVTFQWQSSPDNSTWTNIVGATAATYTPTITSALYFRRITTCSGTPNTGSASVLLHFKLPISAHVHLALLVHQMDITNVTFGTINNTSASGIFNRYTRNGNGYSRNV
ncbi:MAG: hypothetical protein IPG89_03800 [Bacteroidetes bacterium]|nr:hypothetical protein [Bacteroidota bacterium]